MSEDQRRPDRDALREYQEKLFGASDQPEERVDPCDPVIDPRGAGAREESGKNREEECATERAAERIERRTKI